MGRQDSSLVQENTITSLLCCVIFIGYLCDKGIIFKIATLMHQCSNGLAPPYLATDCIAISLMPGRRQLRSAASGQLYIPRTKTMTFGRSLGRDVTARLVSALIISWLDYCNSVLTHLPASTLAPPQSRQRCCLVYDLGPREHVTPAMYELHWLPIAERIKFKLCLLVFHAVNGRAPSYLTELVTPVANIPGRTSLRSAGRHDLVVPRSRLVSSERAFSVAAPRAWNSLPVDMRLITDTKLFKKKLKTFLFNSAYHSIRKWNFV